MGQAAARYDGHADWYDKHFGAVPPEDRDILIGLLEAGQGLCVDLACGGARFADALAGLGYRVVGVDLSDDQLQLAQRRGVVCVRADAGRLPFRDATLGAVAGFYFHTDLENFHAVVAEVFRCLLPGGRFVYLGLHPCFNAPFVDRTRESDEQLVVVEPGYGDAGWVRRSRTPLGLWERVGGHHKTLEGLLGAILDAGLSLIAVRELGGGGTILPRNIALLAAKPGEAVYASR
ncbi:MAG TPA: methyltransferase domain-containing protein [Acidimicrobiales bacterium]|nr:methyltransferase domain-containing protein [Acidimicrobiales bacterium]